MVKRSPRAIGVAGAVVGGGLLIAGLEIAPSLDPGVLFYLAIGWLALLGLMIGLAIRVMAGWIGWIPTVSLALALAAVGFVLTGRDWSGARGTVMPCRRNWAWLPSWLLRASPPGSVGFEVAGAAVKVCYGRPAARGRKMVGGTHVPFGRLWRTGANEPTTIRTAAPIAVAGIPIEGGKASLYTIPGPESWEIILNRSTSQWGLESEYTPVVAAQEIGRAIVPSLVAPDYTDRFTIDVDDSTNPVALVLRWERTLIRLPVTPIDR